MPRKRKDNADFQGLPVKVEQGRYWLPPDAKWGGFINIRLDDDQIAAFEEWDSVYPEGTSIFVDEMVCMGMKVGFAYDREHEAYIISLTGGLMLHSNERYCVTSRAGTLRTAIALAAWKHNEYARGDYSDYAPRSGKLFNFG